MIELGGRSPRGDPLETGALELDVSSMGSLISFDRFFTKESTSLQDRSLKGTFHLRYDRITLHTCFKSNHVSLLKTKLFIEFQIPHKEELKLNCKNFLLQSHLLAISRYFSTL
jgi:hypothetical protein